MFNGEPQADLPVSPEIIALRATDVFPNYSHTISARSGNPQEAWDAFCASVVGFRPVAGLPAG